MTRHIVVPIFALKKESDIDSIIKQYGVPVPMPPPGMSIQDRKKIERLARRVIKIFGLRRRAKDYPVSDWVRRSKKRLEYYLARLEFEVRVREGYK